MKRSISFLLCFSMLFVLLSPMSVQAAAPAGLTWDGNSASLAEIAKNTGYDMVDASGNYLPLYHYYASELWNNGLFLGSDGSFDLDKQLTRAGGVVMTIRILGKEAQAKETTASVTFTDVPDWAKPYVAYAVQNGIVSGYSATTFGSSDPMTAAQFITLALRAMGYKDNDDFTWDKSYDKALEIGLIGQPCHTQYSRSNLFLRDNAAVIAYNALFKAPTKSGGLLKDTISMPGKPTGSVPSATRGESTPTENTPSTYPSNFEIITQDNYFRIYSLPGGNYNAVATYYLFVGQYRGPIDLKVTISPTSVGKTATDFYVVEGRTGEDLYIKYTLSFNITPAATAAQMVTNTIKIEVGDYVYTDSVSVNGTLYSVKIT